MHIRPHMSADIEAAAHAARGAAQRHIGRVTVFLRWKPRRRIHVMTVEPTDHPPTVDRIARALHERGLEVVGTYDETTPPETILEDLQATIRPEHGVRQGGLEGAA